jgi:hypothetical protein
MRKLLLLAGILTLIAGMAMAKAPLEKPVQPYASNSRAAEVEPNDDYLTANALTAGDDMNAAIDVAGDVDFFAYTAAAGEIVDFETLAGDAGDTKMWLYDVDGVTELVFNDDGGDGYYSLINHTFAAAGTYFVMITHYSASSTGTYILTATAAAPPPPPPANDTCAGAIPIEHGAFSISGSTVSALNDYVLGSGSCTGYSANGMDVVFSLGLEAGETFEVTMTTDGFDDSIYLISDCADDFLSCVAGDDAYPDGSTFLYEAPVDQQLFLIVDGYSGSGEFTITGFNGGNVIANDDMSFGSLKASYR